MARTTRRRGQGFSLLALVAVCVLSASFLSARDGAKPASDVGLAAGAASPRVSPKTATTSPSALNTSGFPPLPSGYQRQGALASPVTQTVNRAKLHLSLGLLSLLTDIRVVPRAAPNPLLWVDGSANAYVGSPKGSATPFGTFPPIAADLLGFGMLPVSATVHVTQVPVSGGIEPLHLNFGYTLRVDTDGKAYADSAHMTGEVIIRISDVVVDGVPVDVGDHCQTSTPATLSLAAPGGRFVPGGVRVPPAIFLPYDAHYPNSLAGTVDIPSFVSCTHDDENLDPLITAMVSGPDNPMSATLVGTIGNYTPPS